MGAAAIHGDPRSEKCQLPRPEADLVVIEAVQEGGGGAARQRSLPDQHVAPPSWGLLIRARHKLSRRAISDRFSFLFRKIFILCNLLIVKIIVCKYNV